MEQVFKFSRILYDSPGLFPWVCLVLLCIIIFSQQKRIFAYIDARIESYAAKKQADAIIAELIRNNTAALNNNTVALDTVRKDREDLVKLLAHHEELSNERDKHIQTVINRIDLIVANNSKKIDIIEDRNRY